MPEQILSVNAGSSSVKFALYERGGRDGLAPRCRGTVDGIGAAPGLRAVDAGGRVIAERRWPDGAAFAEVFDGLLRWIDGERADGHLVAAGHRVVHGGSLFSAPVLLCADVLAALEGLVPLAPLHQPQNIAAIRALTQMHPALPQVACFDTAFHHDQPQVVTGYALPREFEAMGIRRYGFHGLSYEYIARALATLAPAVGLGRVIVAHLGAGASLCALRAGRSVDTTMGFSVLDGLPMGTRCGALDPGVVLYLMRTCNLSAAAVEDLLYHRSGLLGISGISGDMRVLLASSERQAAEAIDAFVFRTCREIGALSASLGGLDALVFTAGIGEHAVEIRRRICACASWLGIVLDAAANRAGGPRITMDGSPVAVFVVPTDEELIVAQHTLAVTGVAR